MQKTTYLEPIGAECSSPYFVDGTYDFAAIRCWYVAMTEVTLVFVIVPKYFKYLLQTQTALGQHNTGIR